MELVFDDDTSRSVSVSDWETISDYYSELCNNSLHSLVVRSLIEDIDTSDDEDDEVLPILVTRSIIEDSDGDYDDISSSESGEDNYCKDFYKTKE